jgi:glycosyltransferase involved in cell wall biosynthesis
MLRVCSKRTLPMPDHPSLQLSDSQPLRGWSVVYFGNDWFAENRTSSHHIARRLSRLIPMLYIETPGIRAPQTTARDLRKLWRKLRAAFQPPRKIHDQLWVKTIPQIPFRSLPLMGQVNRWAAEWLTRREVRKLGFAKVLSWFVTPHPGALAKRLGESLTVYYCIDDYAAWPGMDVKAIQALDDELTRVSDVVFVAPAALVEPKRGLNQNVHASPHGVDFDLFAQASGPSTEAAEETRAFQGPVIGYFGTIGEWMDYELVLYLARSRPQWTFLFVGFAAAAGPLRDCPNIVLPGPRPYEELPRWAKAFSVAIYPPLVNRQTKHSNPLKLREYLATGKPVVSVTTPETARFADVVALADTREGFLAAIERALSEDTPEAARRRMDSVRDSSWDARFRETVRVVDELLAARRK